MNYCVLRSWLRFAGSMDRALSPMDQSLASYAVAWTGDVTALEQKLRLGMQPIIGRIHEDRYLLDVRTLWEEDFPVIVTVIREALA